MSKVAEFQVNGVDEDIWLYNSSIDINTPNRFEVKVGTTTYYAGCAPVSTAAGYHSQISSSFRLTVGGTEYAVLKRGTRYVSTYARTTNLGEIYAAPLEYFRVIRIELLTGGQGGGAGGGGGGGGDGGLGHNGGGGGGGRGGAGGIPGGNITYTNLETTTPVKSLTVSIGSGGNLGTPGGTSPVTVDNNNGGTGGTGARGGAGEQSYLFVKNTVGATIFYRVSPGMTLSSSTSAGGLGYTGFDYSGGLGGAAYYDPSYSGLAGTRGANATSKLGAAGGAGHAGGAGTILTGFGTAYGAGGSGGSGGKGGDERWLSSDGSGVSGSPGASNGQQGAAYIQYDWWT